MKRISDDEVIFLTTVVRVGAALIVGFMNHTSPLPWRISAVVWYFASVESLVFFLQCSGPVEVWLAEQPLRLKLHILLEIYCEMVEGWGC